MAPGTSWNGTAPPVTPHRMTRSPSTAAQASENGPPPDCPSVENRSMPSRSAIAAVAAATEASPNGCGVDSP